MRWIRFALISVLVTGACTEPPADDGSPSPSVSLTPSDSPSVVPTGARLADGTPLPAGCAGAVVASQTVAFVADGRAWALDPDTAELSCLFPVDEAGPFSWGPQGDRVLLGGFEVRGLGGDAPDLPAIQTAVGAFDWGHPIGLAVAFADGKGNPRKRFIDDGRLIRLEALPPGSYLEVAYHPSGLALSFVVETDEGQEIWLSTNEGDDPERLDLLQAGNDVHLARLLTERRNALVDGPARGRLSRAPLHAPRHPFRIRHGVAGDGGNGHRRAEAPSGRTEVCRDTGCGVRGARGAHPGPR